MKKCFTGSHGTGKTTSVYKYLTQYKISYPGCNIGVLCENARLTPFRKINKEASIQNQVWIFTNQVQAEISLSSMYDVLVLDRSCVDPIAYTWWHDPSMGKKMLEFSKGWVYTYSDIYFKLVKNNEYLVCDGIRDQDLDYRKWIEDKLVWLYQELSKYSDWNIEWC